MCPRSLNNVPLITFNSAMIYGYRSQFLIELISIIGFSSLLDIFSGWYGGLNDFILLLVICNDQGNGYAMKYVAILFFPFSIIYCFVRQNDHSFFKQYIQLTFYSFFIIPQQAIIYFKQ